MTTPNQVDASRDERVRRHEEAVREVADRVVRDRTAYEAELVRIANEERRRRGY
jgi:hypothetical protein